MKGLELCLVLRDVVVLAGDELNELKITEFCNYDMSVLVSEPAECNMMGIA